jgi:hypothetical protein
MTILPVHSAEMAITTAKGAGSHPHRAHAEGAAPDGHDL